MPQPLNKFRKVRTYSIFPDAPLTRPELAVLLAAVLSHASTVECDIGILLSAIMGTKADAAVAMLKNLTSNSASMAAIDGAASIALPSDLREPYAGTMRFIRGVMGERNDIVHGMWGLSDELPDALLLVDVDTETMAYLHRRRSIRLPILGVAPEVGPSLHLGKISVYQKSDFNRIITRLKIASELLRILAWTVRLEPPWRERWIRQLQDQLASPDKLIRNGLKST